MASSLQGTKRRIKSVNSTRKVTKAMQLVATAKLKKSKNLLEKIKVYTDEVSSSIRKIMKNSSGIESVFLSPNESKSKLYILITSSLGLCGGYNVNVMKLLQSKIDKENDLIYVVGSKGNSYFSNRGYNILEAYEDGKFDYTVAKELTEKLIKLFIDGKVNGVELVYTRFVNSVTFVPETLKLLPFSKEDFAGEEEVNIVDEIKYEPSAKEILDNLVPFYIESSLYGYVLESDVSENAARRIAMENASDNADEIIELLKIEFNKARQGAITQELTEIIAGTDAV